MNRRPIQKHGLLSNGVKHPIYKLRERMLYYCYKVPETKTKTFPYYKGKGIKVCDEWINNIKAFYEWCINNGWKKGLTIDRIDSNGNYEPNNCRFITRSLNSIKARSENDQKGSNSSVAILNEDKVLVIKLLLKLKFTNQEIADFFNVGKSTVHSINIGQTWKHVKEL